MAECRIRAISDIMSMSLSYWIWIQNKGRISVILIFNQKMFNKYRAKIIKVLILSIQIRILEALIWIRVLFRVEYVSLVYKQIKNYEMDFKLTHQKMFLEIEQKDLAIWRNTKS